MPKENKTNTNKWTLQRSPITDIYYIARMSKRDPNIVLEKYSISNDEIRAIAIEWIFNELGDAEKGVEMEIQKNDTILDLTVMRKKR